MSVAIMQSDHSVSLEYSISAAVVQTEIPIFQTRTQMMVRLEAATKSSQNAA